MAEWDQFDALGTGGDAEKLWDYLAETAEALAAADGYPVRGGEYWSDAVRADLDALQDEDRAAWDAVFAHARTATDTLNPRAAKPPQAWLTEARARLADLPPGAFAEAVPRWLRLVGRGRSRPFDVAPAGRDLNKAVLPPHAPTLVGLAWMCSFGEDGGTAEALAVAAKAADVKVPHHGRRVKRLSNACVWALARMPGTAAAVPLARLYGVGPGRTARKPVRTAAEKGFVALVAREKLPAKAVAALLDRAKEKP